MTQLDAGLQPDSLEIRLADLVEEIRRRLAAGETVEPQELAEDDEELAAQIADLIPALVLLNQLDGPAEVDRTLDSGSHAVGESNGNGQPQVLQGVLGDYRIVREIGRGGMGVVYEARQISLDRPVALKVLPFASMLDEKHLARFENEARAAATLDHEHIVHAYAVGCERGVHYFAMQFVQGQNLAEAIKELRRQQGAEAANDETKQSVEGGESCNAKGEADTPDRTSEEASTSPLAGLSTGREPRGRDYFRAIARLTAQAAEALDYAHQRGVVHRDIKPSNLLLDAQQRLHITDFGLANIEGDRNLTATGDIVGTLRYMSPEQAAGDTRRIDHRTDVYSLGATLYELAALKPAFAGDDHLELLRRITQDEPRPLARHNRRVPADLETIVGKAMAKDPADRYATAAALAEDLENFVEDKAIVARPPSLLDRAAKWSWRHRSLVGGLVIGMLLLLASVAAAASIFAARAHSVSKRRVAINRQITDALAETKDLRAAARENDEDWASWAGARAAAGRAAVLADHELADAQFAPRVQTLLRELADEERDRRMLTRIENARLLLAETDAKANVFNKKAALPAYEAAFRQYGFVPRVTSPKDIAARIRQRPRAVQERLISALYDWRMITAQGVRFAVRQRGDRFLVGQILPGESVVMGGRLRGGDEILGVARGDADIVSTVGKSLEEVASLCQVTDLTSLRLQIISQATGEVATIELGHGEKLHWLTEVIREADHDPWRKQFREAWQRNDRATLVNLAHQPDVLNQHPSNLDRLARALSELGASEEATSLLRRAQPQYPDNFWINQRLFFLVPTDDEKLQFASNSVVLRPRSAGARLNLAKRQLAVGRLDEAVMSLEKAIELAPDYTEAYNSLGDALKEKGDLSAAMDAYREAGRLTPRVTVLQNTEAYRESIAAAAEDAEDAEKHHLLAAALLQSDREAEAVEALRRAVELNPNYPRVRANTYGGDKDLLKDAIKVYEAAVELKPDEAIFHRNLAFFRKLGGDLDGAIEAFHDALRLRPYAPWYQRLGDVLGEKGEWSQAARMYQKAIELNPEDDSAHNDLGLAFVELEEMDLAIAEFRRATELCPDNVLLYLNLGTAFARQANITETIASFQRALDLNPNDARACNYMAGILEEWRDRRARAPGLEAALLDRAFWNTLGVAQCRAGRHQEAVHSLNESIKLHSGGSGDDFFFLAMSHWRLGHEKDAVHNYDLAVQWMEKSRSTDKRMKQLRAETATLLGIRVEPVGAQSNVDE